MAAAEMRKIKMGVKKENETGSLSVWPRVKKPWLPVDVPPPVEGIFGAASSTLKVKVAPFSAEFLPMFISSAKEMPETKTREIMVDKNTDNRPNFFALRHENLRHLSKKCLPFIKILFYVYFSIENMTFFNMLSV